MDEGDSIWTLKGTALSDKTARKEFLLSNPRSVVA